MGDNNFHIKNNRLRRFYENADRFADENFAKQERRKDDYVKPARLSMDFPKQAVEALSRIADDKDFPLQEMSDKEILSLGVFLHNIGKLFFYEVNLDNPQKELHEEIAGMSNSDLKSLYKDILDGYKIVRDEEYRKSIAEFIYNIIYENKYFIAEKDYSVTPGERILLIVKSTLKSHLFDNIRDTLNDDEQLTYIYKNLRGAPLERDRSRFNKDDFPKRAVFARFYDNLQ